MSYTPVELRHVRVGRSLFGYNRAMVEQVIEEVAQSFEATWRERGELAEKLEVLEKQLDQFRQREGLLTQTLVAAEQAASDVRERARREAETILLEAHSEARSIGRKAFEERERLQMDSRRIEAMLRSALSVIGEGASAPVKEVSTPVEASVPAPLPMPAPTPAAATTEEPAVRAILPMPPVPEIIDTPVPPAPVERVLPPPPDEDLPGWSREREDTAEFEPIAAASSEPVHAPEPEPVLEHEESEVSHPQPVLEQVSGNGSRDFDWGE